MTDLVSGKSFITFEESSFRSVLSEPFFQKLGSNINALIDELDDEFKVGTLVWFNGDLSELNSQAPGNWVECIGQNISGTDLNTELAIDPYALPDLRGVFLRGLDQGRGFDTGRTALSFQSSKVKAHTHKIINSDPANNVLSSWSVGAPYVGTVLFKLPTGEYAASPNTLYIPAATSGNQDVLNSGDSGSSEGTPKNVNFNLFLKVDM